MRYSYRKIREGKRYYTTLAFAGWIVEDDVYAVFSGKHKRLKIRYELLTWWTRKHLPPPG